MKPKKEIVDNSRWTESKSKEEIGKCPLPEGFVIPPKDPIEILEKKIKEMRLELDESQKEVERLAQLADKGNANYNILMGENDELRKVGKFYKNQLESFGKTSGVREGEEIKVQEFEVSTDETDVSKLIDIIHKMVQ